MNEKYKFFSHKECEFYPCHEIAGDLNCLFCYCPLFFIDCPGSYILLENGLKDCSPCLLPHGTEGWNLIRKELDTYYNKTGKADGDTDR